MWVGFLSPRHARAVRGILLLEPARQHRRQRGRHGVVGLSFDLDGVKVLGCCEPDRKLVRQRPEKFTLPLDQQTDAGKPGDRGRHGEDNRLFVNAGSCNAPRKDCTQLSLGGGSGRRYDRLRDIVRSQQALAHRRCRVPNRIAVPSDQ